MTQGITREAIPFFMPISYHSNVKKSFGESLVELFDAFFNISSDKEAVVLKKDAEVLHGQTVVVQDKEPSSCVITALKVLAYITVVIPLLVLIAKVIMRSIYTFETVRENGSGGDRHLEHKDRKGETKGDHKSHSSGSAGAGAAASGQVRPHFRQMTDKDRAVEVLTKFKELTGDSLFDPNAYRRDEYRVIAVEVNNEAIGFAILHLIPSAGSDNAEVNYFGVDHRFLNKGYERLLLNETLVEARRRNQETISFNVLMNRSTTQYQLRHIRSFCENEGLNAIESVGEKIGDRVFLGNVVTLR